MFLQNTKHETGTRDLTARPTFQGPAALQKLIEHVETPLSFTADDDSALLKEIPINIGTGDAAIGREANSDELSETT